MKGLQKNRSKPFSRILSLLITIVVAASTVSCASRESSEQNKSIPWVHEDLRALDLDDAGISTGADILAVYTRLTPLTMDIRVDLMDLTEEDDTLVTITLWDERIYAHEPLVISIPAKGAAHASSFAVGAPTLLPVVTRDTWLDTITVSLSRIYISSQYYFNVKTSTLHPLIQADEVADVRSDGAPPQERAAVVLEFWNVFKAATSMQALRAWDGAHSGPLGERHGLKYLLDAALKFNVPIALLDVKSATSLPALDLVNGIEKLQELERQRLVVLADAVSSDPADKSLEINGTTAKDFGFTESPFVYSSVGNVPVNYPVQFTNLGDTTHIVDEEGRRYIPLPQTGELLAASDGPSLEMRQMLIAAALDDDTSKLVTLGGDLKRATWGNSDSAGKTLGWLSAHPWIWVLSADDLLVFPGQTGQVVTPANDRDNSPWLAELIEAPRNSASESAWRTDFLLTPASGDDKLDQIKTNYSGQVGNLLAAAAWGAAPTQESDCSTDPDGDGEPECILANQEYFALIDPLGARLVELFSMHGDETTQLVGPTYQFTVGLSDPSEWDLSLEEGADPGAIAGAFADDKEPWMLYETTFIEDGIIFSSPDGSMVKSFHLSQDGLLVEYQGSSQASTQIPLAVGPNVFFTGPSTYEESRTPTGWSWGPEDGIQVKVESNIPFSTETFAQSLPFLTVPENPDKEYPHGAYLPFPMAVVSLEGQDYWVKLSNWE